MIFCISLYIVCDIVHGFFSLSLSLESLFLQLDTHFLRVGFCKTARSSQAVFYSRFYSLWLANCKMSGAHLRPSSESQIAQHAESWRNPVLVLQSLTSEDMSPR